MATLSASTNPIVVDLNAGASNGGTNVSYDKGPMDELWYRLKGGDWTLERDPTSFSGFVGTVPEVSGRFPVRLAPGEIYELGIFSMERGPLGDPDLLAHLVVFAIARRPRSDLIVSDDLNTGGTWCGQTVTTMDPTFAVAAVASRTPLTFDDDGYPFPGPTDGAAVLPLTQATTHELATIGLLPGTPYACFAVVIDDEGRWDYRAHSLKTLRRKLTVQFQTLHVFNDGDSSTTGEGKFHFRVMFMNGPGQPELIEEFERPESEIDDWGETDRPYSLGFAHLGQLERVRDGEQAVWVMSMGSEDDSPFGEDSAWGFDTPLPLPVGPGEKVSNANLQLDCPPASDGSNLHYGVDVVWSAAYEP